MASPTNEKSLLSDGLGRGLITTRQANISDALLTYVDDASANDLDTDAKRIAATHATNTKINLILDVLEAHGLMIAS